MSLKYDEDVATTGNEGHFSTGDANTVSGDEDAGSETLEDRGEIVEVYSAPVVTDNDF